MRAKISIRLGHVKNSVFGLLGFLIPTIITFAAYKLLVAGLGETGFGVYLIATSIGGAMAFMDLGISSANIKFVAEDAYSHKNSSRVASLVWTSAAFYGVVGLVMTVTSFLLAPWLAELFKLPDMWLPDSTLLFTLAALQVGALLVSNVFVGVLKALGRFDLGAAASMITPILSLGGGALGVHYGVFSLLGLVWLGVLGNVIGLFFGLFLSVRICGQRGIVLMSCGPTVVAFKRMFQFSAVLTFHTFAAIFFNQIQRLLIGWSLGPVAVGVFQFPYIAMSKVHALLNAGSEFLYPESSANKRSCEVRKLYLKVFFVVMVGAFLSLGFITALADLIFGLWLGNEISLKVAPLVLPLAIAFFFVAMSIPAHHLLNGVGKPIWNVYYSLCNIVVYAISLVFLNHGGFSLIDFAVAFMISNVLTGLVFQIAVEFVFWPAWLKSE
jgi:O-antigen/teichoic acid export membrane protein